MNNYNNMIVHITLVQPNQTITKFDYECSPTTQWSEIRKECIKNVIKIPIAYTVKLYGYNIKNMDSIIGETVLAKEYNITAVVNALGGNNNIGLRL